MAQLTVTTHNLDKFTLEVNDVELEKVRRIRPDDWVTFAGTDGKTLTLHSKSIASILSVKGATP